jgi:hypothetical protein
MSLVFRLSCESFVGGPSFDIWLFESEKETSEILRLLFLVFKWKRCKYFLGKMRDGIL